MKGERLGTDQQLEIAVYADGVRLPEYVLPGAKTHPNIAECFVPVEAGEEITVRGRFEGTTLAASFDLVVDGSFLQDSRINDKGARQHAVRTLRFERVYDCPSVKPGWTSQLQPPLDVYEADMFTQPIEESSIILAHIEDENKSLERPGVGSIQVVVNMKDTRPDERKDDAEWDIEGGGWIHRFQKPVRSSGIKPTYSMEVRRASSTPIKQKRSKTHRNHWNMHARFGTEPWGRFVFYYRSQTDIDKAQCVLREDKAQQLVELTEAHKLALAAAEAYDLVDEDMTGFTPRASGAASPGHSLPQTRKSKRLRGKLDLQKRHSPEEKPAKASLSDASDTYVADGLTRRQPGDMGVDRETEYGKRNPPPALATNQGTKVAENRGNVFMNPCKEAQDRTSAAKRRGRVGFQNRLTSGIGPLSHANSFIYSSAPKPNPTSKQTNAASPPQTSTNMALYPQQVIKLPELAEIIQLIGPEGISQRELNIYYNDIAKAENWVHTQSLYAKLRAEFNNRVAQVADSGTFKVTLKERYLNPPKTTTATSRQGTPAAANMVIPQSDRDPRAARVSAASADRTTALKRAASESATPEASATNKKVKTEGSHAAAMEAHRRYLDDIRAETAAYLEKAEKVKAAKAEKKARKEREKAERRERERIELERAEKERLEFERAEKEREELEMVALEEQALKEQLEAAEAFAKAEMEESESDDDEESVDGDTFEVQEEGG
ncbi:hypothetical protein CERZMDRAFT_86549 [Cercospora zeae-maydis SCOH1-5]|uniref:Uncharacterized protein n=1 Tax=Cercospora zeae-maydis SCOH1-5 TaxID=717836 RepID=A0A6A6F932_9PEZI|nr:hypothetical protein CERZMDRAFT_86549 [Cercospora zeae-maydis SCOH1-5]